MRVDVVLDQTAIRTLLAAQVKAAKLTAGQLRTQLIQSAYMPFDVGTLQNVATEVDDTQARAGKISIVHDTPYAMRLYYNPQYNFQKTTNVNARGLWWEDWLVGPKKNEAKRLFELFLVRESGGIIR